MINKFMEFTRQGRKELYIIKVFTSVAAAKACLLSC
jgi:hypothetical protein